jgi:hypothetical protein
VEPIPTENDGIHALREYVEKRIFGGHMPAETVQQCIEAEAVLADCVSAREVYVSVKNLTMIMVLPHFIRRRV